MITPDILRNLPIGTILHHVTLTGPDRLPVRCRTSGKLREWKRYPDRWEQPVRHGLRNNFIIGPGNAHLWVLPGPG
jgi:hypothetical protein